MFESLMAEIMPPSIASARWPNSAACVVVVRAVGGERLLVLGQRMARQVEAEHFLFLGQAVAFAPLGQLGQIGGAGLGRFVILIAAEEAQLPASAVRCRRRAGLQCPVDCREELRPLGAERVERAGLDQRLDGRAIDGARIEPFAEVEEAAIRAVGGTLLGDGARPLRRRSP